MRDLVISRSHRTAEATSCVHAAASNCCRVLHGDWTIRPGVKRHLSGHTHRPATQPRSCRSAWPHRDTSARVVEEILAPLLGPFEFARLSAAGSETGSQITFLPLELDD